MNIVQSFKKLCVQEPDQSEGILAIKLLNDVIKNSDVTTVQGLKEPLDYATKQMLSTASSYPSVKSACELYQRFITMTVGEIAGDVKEVDKCREEIARHALPLLHDGMRLMLHSDSRVVLSTVEFAVVQAHRRNIHCYVTLSSPENSGKKTYDKLRKLGVSSTLIPDSSIAYFMPEVDAVLLGAEAVVESGGILNRLGSCSIAMIAHCLNKPVYAFAESYKFVRSYPLDQRHMPDEFKWGSVAKHGKTEPKPQAAIERPPQVNFEELDSPWERLSWLRVSKAETEVPSIDYTGPAYLTLLVSDLGALTPSAVSDELIKLYM